MGGLLDGPSITGLSVATVCLASWWWIARQVLRGKLVPRQQLLDKQADLDHYRGAADTLLKASLEQGMTQEKLTTAVEKALANSEVILHVVQGLQQGLQQAGDEP